jgi:hypothetical protein
MNASIFRAVNSILTCQIQIFRFDQTFTIILCEMTADKVSNSA